MPPKVPKWRQIADEFAAEIAEGSIEPGDQLPHIAKLVQEGKGSTATIHRAYQALEAEGLVRTSRGHGTTVLSTDEMRSAVTGAARIARLKRTGRPLAPKETVIDRRSDLRSCADPEYADLLGIELHDEVILRRRTFVRDGLPVILAFNVIHMRALRALPELLDAGPMTKWRHDLYTERTGQRITADPERRSARFASGDELEAFGISLEPHEAAPVLVLRTLFRDDEGPLELWEDVYRPGIEQVADS